MRRDGDILVSHVARAKNSVLLCAPFVKTGVIKRLFAAIHSNVAVEIVTRWNLDEIAVGVSDLAVFDLAVSRPGTTMRLLDNLHAKLYFSDDTLLAGSANLTAKALGWCEEPNLELLVIVPSDDEAVVRFRSSLSNSRLATVEERESLQARMDALDRTKLPEGEPVMETLSGFWLPRLAAPEKLFSAYLSSARERLTTSAIEAADHDLAALVVDPNLDEKSFHRRVAEQFSSMPAIKTILAAAQKDLTDTAAVELIESFIDETEMSHAARWQIVREWLTFFMPDEYEIAPHSFVTRVRPGARQE
jgi:PLD-like domain